MNIVDELNKYGLTLEQYENILKDIDSIKEGTMSCDSNKWQYIVDKYDLQFNKDSIRKANDTPFSGYFRSKYTEWKHENSNTESDAIKELEQKKREVNIEVQKLRDINAEYRQLQREQSRLESMYEIIDRAYNKRINKVPQLYTKAIRPTVSNKEIVACFADVHYGADFVINGLRGEVINKYNPDVVKASFEQLYNEIVDFARLNRINKLRVVDLGDGIEGILHLSQLRAMKSDMVDDIIDYADIVTDFLSNLLKEGFIIDMYTSTGNHSDLRLLSGKKGDFPHENVERIYSRWLKNAFKHNSNIIIHDNINGINYFNVCGYDFLSTHGQNERGIKSSIRGYEETYGVNINYLLVGHLHSKNEFETAINKEVIQVRSMMGINEYSQTIKKTAQAGALMFTVEEGYGKRYVNEVKFNNR